MKIQLRILNSLIRQFGILEYATAGSAGLDIRACIENELVLAPQHTQLIPTGLAMHIANPGFAGFIYPRSGLGHKYGIVLGNSVGVIDSDYQGELQVSLFNRSQTPYTIQPGERIAQLVIQPIQQVSLEEVDEFSLSARGAGGFGHTGKS